MSSYPTDARYSFVIDIKSDKIVVFGLDLLPLLPIYLPYPTPYPFVKTLDIAFHIGYGIITEPTYREPS